MINCIYTVIPREKITYRVRPEFINGEEKSFYDNLKKSIIKLGIKDKETFDDSPLIIIIPNEYINDTSLEKKDIFIGKKI